VSAIGITAAAARGQRARLRRLNVDLRRSLARLAAPAAAPLTRLAQMPLTLAGIGCIDAAAFVGDTIAGLVVTGLSLIGLEYLIADDE
jgi:hypothetical protein